MSQRTALPNPYFWNQGAGPRRLAPATSGPVATGVPVYRATPAAHSVPLVFLMFTLVTGRFRLGQSAPRTARPGSQLGSELQRNTGAGAVAGG